jgi:transcription elongation GreA/GreB family factor
MHDLPRVFLTPVDHKQLKRVVSAAYNQGQRTAAFLDSEMRRAVVGEPVPKNVVKPGSLVRYQLDWGPFSPVRELVYPNYFTGDSNQISLLSEIGVALLGLRRGDIMQVFVLGVGFRTLHVATVVDPEAESRQYSSYQ